MKKRLKHCFLLLVFLPLGALSVAQESETSLDLEHEIKFLKSKKVSKIFNSRAHTLVRGKTVKRVMTRCKIDPYGDRIDINAFSLVDTINKLQYRLSDISAYRAFGGPGIKQYLQERPLNKKGEEMEVFFAEYDPSVQDTFFDYRFEGYKISESKYPLSSGQRIATYYGVAEGKSRFTADLYFVIAKDKIKSEGYALYFGDKKISDVSF